MSIFFGFSDECGSYQLKKSKNYLTVHPYYIRSTLLIKADDWKIINKAFTELKTLYSLPIEKEVKWAYLWQLRNYQTKGLEIPKEKDFKFLETYDYYDLIGFIEKSLALLESIEFKKVIITHTNNTTCSMINEKAMLKMHLQEHMQRIEMQIQTRTEDNLAVLFFDPVSENTDRLFRDIYYELYSSGDFINSYKHIKDSLNIENSHQSVGIQLADYVSGAFSAILKGRTSKKYDRGKQIFFKYVYPYLRKHNGVVLGVGIREVPKDMAYRQDLKRVMNSEMRKWC